MSQDKDKNSPFKSQSDRLAEIVEENQRRREERAFLEELGKRISLAREGRVALEKSDLTTAMNCYRRFLNITARAVKVNIDDLHPRLFEEKNRDSESLLISAIAMDLAKILDQVDNDSATKERAAYIRLFINFTVGRSYQGFVAENLRKQIAYSKTMRHREEFRAAYDAIRIRRACFLATSIYEGGSVDKINKLRRFRENHLRQNPVGRAFIRWYYANSPKLAKKLRSYPKIKGALRAPLNLLVSVLPKD